MACGSRRRGRACGSHSSRCGKRWAGSRLALLIDGETVALNPAAVDVDVVEFERQVAEGTPAALDRAAALYRGELLEGLALQEAPFEEWLLAERERLRELALEALAKLLRTSAPRGRRRRRCRRRSGSSPSTPCRSRSTARSCVSTSSWAGGPSALRQYQLCVGVLQRELGVEPEATTKQLYQEILRQRPPHAAATWSARRRRRRCRPKRRARRRTLPRELPLVGREAEIDRLREAWTGRGRDTARSWP